MIANYHTHTPRCHHATGTEEDYVRCALEAGLRVLGFSDHTPYPFPGDYRSPLRMGTEEMPDYCRGVLAVKEKYASQIKIHLGAEAEYYPAYFQDYLDFMRQFPVEYLILGQHYIGNEIGCAYTTTATEDVSVLTQYCEQTAEALHTGLFSYMAHPDSIRYTGSEKIYLEQLRKVCKAAKETDTPLELNLLGMRGRRHYPNWRFWEMAAEENCTVIFGSDAHNPHDVADPVSERQALEVVRRLGMKYIEILPLRSIEAKVEETV